MEEFRNYQDDMRDILSEISENFLIGDCGITGKNYGNWGIRNDGTICILDFAYIYNVTYNVFNCTSCADEPLLRYDKNYVDLICPVCGRKYSFGDIRRRITRKDQENEIGDIRRLGYNLKSSKENVVLNPDFEPKVYDDRKKKKKYSETELAIKEYNRRKKMEEDTDEDYWDQ